MPSLLKEYLWLPVNSRVENAVQIYVHQILKILVIAAGNRVYGLIRIRHGIQKCVQRTFYQFHKGVLDRKLIRTFQYTVFQYMGKSRTVIGRCTETDIEHLVLILIGHQKNPGAAFYVFQHHGPGVHFLHVHLF